MSDYLQLGLKQFTQFFGGRGTVLFKLHSICDYASKNF